MQEGIQIRKMQRSEAGELAKIWLETSLKAHHFIQREYWVNNKLLMEEKYLPNAEVYIAAINSNIAGFIALMDDHIAALFVSNDNQGKGIGTTLLEYAKEIRSNLTLSVYKKNESSVGFYRSNGFKILSEEIDRPTGEKEYTMQWER